MLTMNKVNCIWGSARRSLATPDIFCFRPPPVCCGVVTSGLGPALYQAAEQALTCLVTGKVKKAEGHPKGGEDTDKLEHGPVQGGCQEAPRANPSTCKEEPNLVSLTGRPPHSSPAQQDGRTALLGSS